MEEDWRRVILTPRIVVVRERSDEDDIFTERQIGEITF